MALLFLFVARGCRRADRLLACLAHEQLCDRRRPFIGRQCGYVARKLLLVVTIGSNVRDVEPNNREGIVCRRPHDMTKVIDGASWVVQVQSRQTAREEYPRQLKP